MGKSRYQLKAQKSLELAPKKAQAGRARYYDEEIEEKATSSTALNSGALMAGVIISIIVGASLYGVITYVNNHEPQEQDTIPPPTTNTNGGSTTTTTIPNANTIEAGDTANIHYKLWIDEDHDLVIDTGETPYQESDFPTEVSKGKVINGFYYALLGMTLNQEKTFEIPPNVDANSDGFDDNTGQEVLGYGNPSDDLYNTKLIFYIKILSITKA